MEESDSTSGRRHGMWTELVNTGREELSYVREADIALLPHSLVLLRYGRERRLTPGVTATEERLA